MTLGIQLLACTILFGNLLTAKEFSGYYIGIKSDTVICQFEIPLLNDEINYPLIASQIRIIESSGKKRTIRPGQIRGFVVETMESSYQFESVKLYESYTFLKVVDQGWAKLYHHYFPSEDGKTYYDQYVLKFPFRNAIVIRPKRFKKQMLNYTSNDPFFVATFQNETSYQMIASIIAEYNELKLSE